MIKKIRTLIAPMKQPKKTPADQKSVFLGRGTRNPEMATGDGKLPAPSLFLPSSCTVTWCLTAFRDNLKGKYQQPPGSLVKLETSLLPEDTTGENSDLLPG